MLSTDLFTASPAGNNAPVLLKNYQELLLTNLLNCLRSIQTSLRFDISDLILKYEHLTSNRKFSPAIFNSFSKLTNAVKTKRASNIINALHGLSLLTEDIIYKSEFELSTILTEEWEIDFVNTIRADHIPAKNGDVTIITPILNPNLSGISDVIQKINGELELLDEAFYKEVKHYVTRLKLFNGKALKAATSASVFGAIYLNLPTKGDDVRAYFAEHLIHETSHLQLDILLAFDRIILNDSTEVYTSPLRIDPRPMFGVFHATFVLSRMVRIFNKMINYHYDAQFASRLEVFQQQFYSSLEIIDKYAILTENGKKIKASLLEVVNT